MGRGVRRAIWVVNGAGFVYTVVALVGLALGAAVIVASVVRAVSHLPIGWLFALGGGAGLLVLVAATMAVAAVLGSGAKMTQPANSSWVTYSPDLNQLALTASILVANGSATDPLITVGLEVRSFRTTPGKRRRTRTRIEAQVARWSGPLAVPIEPGGADYRTTSFQVDWGPKIDPPKVVRAKVALRDHLDRTHRGTLTFLNPPVPPPKPRINELDPHHPLG